MADEYNKGQVVLLTETLTDPTNNDAPADDASLMFTVTKPDGTPATVTTVQQVSTGMYRTTVTADQSGWWHVSDTEGGYYTFWVKPTVP